jgi:cupin fold WbuC family metalloprotein
MNLFFDSKKFNIDRKKLLSLVNKKVLSKRILYHDNVSSKFHLMMICHHKNYKISPFKFKSFKKKLFIHLGGKAIFKFYNVNEKLIKILNFDDKNRFIYIDESFFYYKQTLLSEKLIFFEVTNGPFILEDKMYLSTAEDFYSKNKKNILYLTNKKKLFKNKIVKFLEKDKNIVSLESKKVSLEYLKKKNFDFVISDRYDKIIKKDVIRKYKNKIFNIHHSFLPYARGTNPIFWSVYNRFPYGVSIHHLVEKVDAGDIIAQKRILYNENQNLNQLYNKTRYIAEKLFIANWEKIKTMKYKNIKNDISKSSIYFKKDNKLMLKFLKNGWFTKIKDIK